MYSEDMSGSRTRQLPQQQQQQQRTVPIPRPWLTTANATAPTDARCNKKVEGMSSNMNKHYNDSDYDDWGEDEDDYDNDAITLLDKPSSHISWTKLITCFFCLNNDGNGDNQKKKLIRSSSLSITKKKKNTTTSNSHKQHKHRNHGFSGLVSGMIRRHSSFTLTSDDQGLLQDVLDECFPPKQQHHHHHHHNHHNHNHNYYYSSEGTGPGHQHYHQRQHDHDDDDDVCCSVVSDFTETETSSYSSMLGDDEDENDYYFRRHHSSSTNKRRTNSAPAAFTIPTTTEHQDDNGNKNEDHDDEITPEKGRTIKCDIDKDVVDNNNNNNNRRNNENDKKTTDTTSAGLLSTAPTPLMSNKPPTISNRSRSVGLPPLNPALSGTSNTINRQRTDTGDYTRNSTLTGTTNTSRHRRQDGHFAFSSQSMSDIWKGGERDPSMPPPPPPPSYVSFQERTTTTTTTTQQDGPSATQRRQRLQSNDGVSLLGLNESIGGESIGAFSWEVRGDDEEDNDNEYKNEPEDHTALYGDLLPDIDSDDDSGSPFAGLKRKPDHGSHHHDEGVGESQINTSFTKTTANGAAMSNGDDAMSGYLRKSPLLDGVTADRLVLSGWIVALVRDEVERPNAAEENNADLLSTDYLGAKDVYYLRVVVSSVDEAFVLLHRSDGTIEHSFFIQRDWILESKEISSRIGRCVRVRTSATTDKSLLLLPVSLESCFFTSSGDIVSETRFSRLRDEMFVRPGSFAPEHQIDSVTFLMFSIDSLVKQYGK